MQEIKNSELKDVPKIFELYRTATTYMKSKNQVAWPKFSPELIDTEIKEKRQWKILLEDQIACIWVTALDDELIWGEKNNTPAVYLHRIATNPDFRGQNFVKKIVAWADNYGNENNLTYIRMDTVGLNKGLIKHYQKFGFDFLGAEKLKNTTGLPDHYKEGKVCLFERAVQK